MFAKRGSDGAQVHPLMVVSVAVLQLPVTKVTFSNLTASHDVHVTSWFG
jgi:hypothetical protein